jgi:hypothetical protein
VTGRASSERAGDGAGHARTRAVGTTAALDVEGWVDDDLEVESDDTSIHSAEVQNKSLAKMLFGHDASVGRAPNALVTELATLGRGLLGPPQRWTWRGG